MPVEMYGQFEESIKLDKLEATEDQTSEVGGAVSSLLGGVA